MGRVKRRGTMIYRQAFREEKTDFEFTISLADYGNRKEEFEFK